jgi:hypothetical protein
MNTLRTIATHIWPVIFLTLFLAGCNLGFGGPPPVIGEPQVVKPPPPVPPGAEVSVKIAVSSAESVSYQWKSDERGGEIISGGTFSAATWRAPQASGTYNVTVEVIIDEVVTTKSVAIKVQEKLIAMTSPINMPSPSPIYTPTPTLTPTPSATPTPHGILLDDFEDDIDGWYAARAGTNGWKENEVAVNVFLNSDAAGGSGALRCDFEFERTEAYDPRATCFFVELPVQDWTKYNALQFKAKSLIEAGYNLRVFIALATGDEACWNELGDFQMIGSEYQTLTFNLDRALYKTCQSEREYDQVLWGKGHVVRLHLIFTAEHKPSGAVLVDEIWLVKP